MASDAVQQWLRGTQKEPVSIPPTKTTENSWIRGKRLCSFWHSPDFGAVVNLEARD